MRIDGSGDCVEVAAIDHALGDVCAKRGVLDAEVPKHYVGLPAALKAASRGVNTAAEHAVGQLVRLEHDTIDFSRIGALILLPAFLQPGKELSRLIWITKVPI